MSIKKSPIDYILVSLKGIAMGAADVVPGVSGGTIAFITGIYDELLGSINNINIKALKVLKADGLKSFWNHINGNFLLFLFLGIGISIASLAKLIAYLMKEHEIALWSFFMGLVAASIVYVAKQVTKWNVSTIVSFIIGTAIAYFITILPPMQQSGELWFIFLAGMIAICAMILPGISGSFILLILGAYQTVLEAVNDRNILIIGVFISGCAIGLLSFSRLLKFLLDRFRNITIAVLAGFLLGSLNKIWPWKKTLEVFVKHPGEANEELVPIVQENVLPSNFDGNPQTLYAILFLLLGLGLLFGIEYFAKSLQKKSV